MPRAVGYKQFISPNEGLITEQTILSPVEASTVEEVNFGFSENGSQRQRRLGLAPEESSSPFELGTTEINEGTALSYALWENAGGIGGNDYHVFQIRDNLYIIKDQAGNLTPTSDVITYDIDTHTPAGVAQVTEDTVLDMTSGEGNLYCVGKEVEPFYLTLSGSTVKGYQIPLRIRDFTGVDDSLEVDYRPTSGEGLSDEHKYNLLNQGWAQGRRIVDGGAEVDPISTFLSGTTPSVYPSNADIAYLGMVDDGEGNLIFEPEELTLLTVGNTPAPKGHFIIDPFLINYQDVVDGVATGLGGGYGGSAETNAGTAPVGGGGGYPYWYQQPNYTYYSYEYNQRDYDVK